MHSFRCLVVAAALLAALAEGDATMMPEASNDPKAEEQQTQPQPQPLLDEGRDVDVSLDRVRRQVGGFAIGFGDFGGRRGGGRSDRRDGPFRNPPPYRGGLYGGPFYGGPFGNPYQGRRYAGRFPGDFFGR
ncbi:uncharacterized protein LOC111073725 [Drosophila obscura]|uniref:uncharacterized protein LOC111073725 n=1 Tax=Drosophila obscura TaxID=7282 RepID=UPI001BB14D72|nr:uncharacterized protein LOC111073725 [Drosophila obscura]